MRRHEAPPPGWYPDPTGRRDLLWWDGLDWTHHRRPPPAATHAAPVPSAPAEEAPARGQVTVDEVRRATREEVERAVTAATRQLRGRQTEWQDRLDQWRRRVTRWARIVTIVVVVLVALSAWASATLQTSLLDWLGERIDAATATVGPPQSVLTDR